MEYVQEQFPYGAQHPHQQVYYPPAPYNAFPPHPHPLHQQQLEEFYQLYPHAEYADFVPYQEEFEEIGEVSTRPRLTKEQSEVLEAHFQANHKPNSMVKRQLAMQTKLTLPRVANWFQNRRAKAKQQRKQEEFESSQSQSLGPAAEDEPEDPVEVQTHLEFSKPQPPKDLQRRPIKSEDVESHSTSVDLKSSKEASWASLQRAINQAKAERAKNQHQALQQTQMQRSASNDLPQQSQLQVSMQASSNQPFEPVAAQWPNRHSLLDPWSPTHFQDTSFDFGFDHPNPAELPREILHEGPRGFAPVHDLATQDSWQEAFPTPRGIIGDHAEAHLAGSPDMPLPHYPESRRGSAAESLTANFGTFALAGESPQSMSTSLSLMTETLPQSEGHIDLAARRKRPRPAALTSAALRSRSYGALTSVSPTIRPGMTPGPHTVRHVKSTGHSLNARFGGIRKASSAQRSPINVSTFAEAEALNRLMAQQAAAAAATMPGGEGPTPVPSPALAGNTQMPLDDGSSFFAQKFDLASRYQLPNTQHLTLSTASPPTTPFNTDFTHHGHHLSMPPVSAPPQYATFPECTPPYSAGPLTNSSWSDAPLTSPEFPNFPPVTHIPSLHHPQKIESPQSQFQQFVLASDHKYEPTNTISTPEQKKMEFFIQEFPNQKEEHAHVAQQLAPSRPKNYVFANTAPGDYDQS